MSECYCDYEPASFHVWRIRTARKKHRCEACSRNIQPGERYEQATGKWGARVESFATCAECVNLREYVQAHVPCFCWCYQTLFEDALETLREYAHVVPGMGMESGRLIVAMRARTHEAWRQRRYAA